MLCCEYPLACSREHSSVWNYSFSRFTHRDEDGVVSLWNVEVARDQGVNECLLESFAETSDFSGGDHFDPCHRVRLVQSCEGELRCFHSDSSVNSFALLYGPVSMASAARSIRFVSIVLDTNGILREARRLHSITRACPFLTRNWMLNGPRILRLLAILLE